VERKKEKGKESKVRSQKKEDRFTPYNFLE
jgi:hypothetical protein